MAYRRPPPWRDYSHSYDRRYDDNYGTEPPSRDSYRPQDYRQSRLERYEGSYSRQYEEYDWADRQMPQRSAYSRSSPNYHPYARDTYPSSPRALPRESPRRPLIMDRRDDRSVTPPPAPSPSPSYLALSEEPPTQLSRPTEGRKLIILDLNGTLVYRAPHQRAKQHDEHGHSLPRLRPVHPRPYMQAFRSYLFTPETKDWLDVMIWSSAQPHSVSDMVEHTFGKEEEHLVAIWARDTLGLSEAHYHRKVQTVKDLNTPWKKLPELLGQVDDHPSEASSPRSSRASRSPAPQTAPAHSALTTLLLDDSPKKAVCQPYNHVCLPEYSSEERAKDVKALSASPRMTPDVEVAAQGEESLVVDEEAEDAVERELDPEEARKQRRKEKKERKKAARKAQQQLSAAPSSPPTSDIQPDESTGFNETLLAVIGILEEIKMQKNVAAWIRSGGLWGSHPQSMLSASNGSPSANVDAPSQDAGAAETHLNSDPPLPSSPGNDAITSTGGPSSASAGDTAASNPLWFEHQPTVDFWVAQGKEALRRLGIPIVHGLQRP